MSYNLILDLVLKISSAGPKGGPGGHVPPPPPEEAVSALKKPTFFTHYIYDIASIYGDA